MLNQDNAGIAINRNRSERSSDILAKLAADEVMDISYTTFKPPREWKKIEKVDAISVSHALEHPVASNILYEMF